MISAYLDYHICPVVLFASPSFHHAKVRPVNADWAVLLVSVNTLLYIVIAEEDDFGLRILSASYRGPGLSSETDKNPPPTIQKNYFNLRANDDNWEFLEMLRTIMLDSSQ
ncbi:hypothetical protein Agabi119p4_3980 [Agaricus bisporus var. burnettii]|uniref:Uncharacterized protein n=1 Tax=Agaricus bisporus var. burnettii TaxID=192524 RepID=A0A8H7KIH6_AGABI|nr:hypothetical protein Agabi119p4_3980 [Agaricus bisporus var. burnettii]